MADGILGQILGQVLGGGAQRQEGGLGGLGGLASGGSGGGLGDILGSIMGGGSSGGASGGLGGLGSVLGGLGGLGGSDAGEQTGGSYANKTTLLAMMLPLAMQWVQRNGGIGAVLQKFNDKGYGNQASSWVSTGSNQLVAPDAINEVVGQDELARMSQQLGVGEQEVSDGFAQILPEMVDKLSPQGEVLPDAQNRIDDGVNSLQDLLGQLSNLGQLGRR
ncbi:MAG TPA: YidB family protein [Ramlibacter sp.]|nr:YidB family protein [Ramlibacter sp.]